MGADLTSAWEVGNTRRGLEPIRGPRKRKVGDHLLRGELRLGLFVMCILVVEMGEVERELSGGRQFHSHMSGVLLPSHIYYVYVPNLLCCNSEMHDRCDCSDLDVRWLLADRCR